MVRTLMKDEEFRVAEIDKDVKNKFKWEWFEKTVKLDIKIGKQSQSVSEPLANFIKKSEIAGKALCVYCNGLINYGSRGYIALVEHATKVKKHAENVSLRRSNYSLGSAFNKQKDKGQTSSKDVTSWGTLAHQTSDDNNTVSVPFTPIADRQAHSEALILGVLAEHSLPLSFTPVLVTAAKELAKDPRALNEVKLNRMTASYKLVHGLGKTFSEEVVSQLQNGPFSLNIDESTSNNNERILAILGSYVCQKQKKVVVQHLRSIELFKVNTESVYSAISHMFTELKFPWGNLVSILMDSCAVMRGSKNGLEVRIRREKAPQLLDIDGDSCHHVQNACKRFCTPFEGWVERLASDLHNDIKWSADLKILLSEVCEILGVAFVTPQRFVSHRWLSCYDVTLCNLPMMDAFYIFYFGFMQSRDSSIYKSITLSILEKHAVSEIGKSRIKEIWRECNDKNLTEDGRNRKMRIIEKIIVMNKKTKLHMSFYLAVLRVLKDYVLLFQSKAPLIHILHDKQEELLRNFLSYFIKPERLVNKSASKLKEINLKIDEGQFLSQENMFMGTTAENIVKTSHPDKVLKEFFQKALAAYIQCGIHLQRKLPLDSKLLRALSAVDPIARGHRETLKCLKTLMDFVKPFLTPADTDSISQEAHQYQVDISLPEPNAPVDEWWAAVKDTNKYPALAGMVMPLLTCFHGPQVEASFNLMGDTIDIRSARMNVSTFNAYQTIKYGLKAKETTSVKMFAKPADVRRTVVTSNLSINMRTAAKQQKELWQKNAELKKQRQTKMSINRDAVPSGSKAQQGLVEAEKECRLNHLKTAKRKATERLMQLAAKRRK